MRKSSIYWSIFFVALLLVNFGLRFWKAPSLFVFGLDEEYQSTLALSLVKDLHPIWIGVSAANTGFYLGPGFTYLSALLLKISSGDPLIFSYAAVILSILTILSLYYIVRQLLNSKTALFAAIMYSFSTLLINYDLRFWNPSPVPLVSIWLIYSLYKLKDDFCWIVLTLSLLALSLHTHLSLLVFWPITIITVIQNRKKLSLKWLIIAIATYFLFISPLIVYDLNHNFDNLKTPLRLLTSTSSLPTDSSNHFVSLVKNLGDMVISSQSSVIGTAFSLTLLVAIILRLRQNKLDLLAISSCLIIAIYLLYPGVVHGYYLLALYPLLAIILGNFLYKLPLVPVSLLILLFILLNLSYFIKQDTSQGLLAKKSAIQSVSNQIGSGSYELLTDGEYRQYGGWRYLFKVYAHTPHRSSADSFFGWIYPDEISSQAPLYKVLISRQTSNPITVTQLK